MRVCKTTDTRRQLPVFITLIHRDDESDFTTTITIMGDILLRETIHCAKGGILYFFFSAIVPEDKTSYIPLHISLAQSRPTIWRCGRSPRNRYWILKNSHVQWWKLKEPVKSD